MSRLIWVFLIAAAVTAAATPLAILIAPKIGAMDIPKDNRRMHTKPIPRFGGIAIFLGIAVGFISIAPLSQQTRGLLVGAVMILLLGIVDDLKDISAKVKLAGQIICAGGLLDDEGRMKGSALVMEFENRAALDDYFKNEPYVVEGVWKKVEVEMMNVVLVNREKK